MFLLAFSVSAEDISTTLEIDYDGDGVIDKTVDHEISEGSTAYDLLEATVGVEVEMTDWGVFVVGIDDKMTNWDDGGTWWLFEVNGEMSDVGVDSYTLEDGDVVAMSLKGAGEGYLTAFLEIDYDGDGMIDKTVHKELAEGSTALDLLLRGASQVTVVWQGWGAFLVGIDGRMTDWEDEGTWWLFEVNEEQVDVGVDSYVLEQGDVVSISLIGAEDDAITAVLELDYDGDGTIDKAIHHEMDVNSSALDLLDEVSEVIIEETDWGALVVGIDGWMTNYDDEGTWWLFEVNGVQSDVGVASYILEDGDSVTMTLSGAEEGAITVVLKLDYDGDGMIDKAIHNVMMEDSTALDLLNEVSEITTEEKEWGMLVVGIDGWMTNYEDEGTWWIFEANGVMSEFSVDSYILESGDMISMSFGGAEEAEAHKAATS